MINIDIVLEGEREKVKAEVNEYLYALKCTHRIDWFAYRELNDLVMPLLDKCYDLTEEVREAESEKNNGI